MGGRLVKELHVTGMWRGLASAVIARCGHPPPYIVASTLEGAVTVGHEIDGKEVVAVAPETGVPEML